MKNQLAQLVEQTLRALRQNGTLPAEAVTDIQLERGRARDHGDYSANIAMQLAKPVRRSDGQTTHFASDIAYHMDKLERGWSHSPAIVLEAIERLTQEHERPWLAPHNQLGRYPELVETAALTHEPHQLGHYLRKLANAFHTYYNAHPFLVSDAGLRNARLNLILATRQVLRNGLTILGVAAPKSM